MKTKLKWVMAAFVLAGILLTGCENGADYITGERSKLPSEGDSWSVFVYMCGSSLEGVDGNASDALKSMMNVDYTENINVVVETGGAMKWGLDCIDTNYLDRFEMQKGGMYLVERAEDENMAKSTTLSDFLRWGSENYPADHYAVIVWGYGGGSKGGALYDERYGNDPMTQERLAYAIADSPIHFDLVGMDSNLMGSLEMANALSLNADYMVASQEIVQGCGWDYSSWLTYLTEHPKTAADTLGAKICDSYYEACDRVGRAEMATLSVIDLSSVSTLSQAFDGMAGAMLAASDSFEDYVILASALPKTVNFGANSPEEGYTNMVDLGSLADKAELISDNTAALVHDAINASVLYKVNGAYRNDASGISVYYPLHQNEDEIKSYIQNSISVNYNDFLRFSCANITLDDGRDNYNSSWAFACYNNEKEYLTVETKQEDGCYEMDMMGNMDVIRNVDLEEYYYDDITERFLYIGDRTDIEENTDAGIFKNYLSNRIITLNGHYVTVSPVSAGNGYEILSIPVEISGARTNIRAVCTNNSEGEQEYTILGAWDGINQDNGMAERNIRNISAVSRIAPVYRIYDSPATTLSTAFIPGVMGTNLEEKKMKDGKYILRYRIKYLYDNDAYTDSANIGIDGKNISFR